MAGTRLSSEDLAGLIVDALVEAGLLSPDEVERAAGIVIEELDAAVGE